MELPRRVLIGTPSIDGKLDANYVNALTETMFMGLEKDIIVRPVYICYDSLIQRARNEIFKIAFENTFDDLIFIDADQEWIPSDFFKLLSYPVDIVAGTVIKKGNEESYNVKLLDPKRKMNELGLFEVEGVGTGFMRLTKRAIQKLWKNSEMYKESRDKEGRMVFEITIRNGELYSEDINMCQKWIDLGEKVYIDPTITCAHIGIKKFVGNFMTYFNNVTSQTK